MFHGASRNHCLLAVFLLEAAGSSGPYQPYIDSLPDDFSNFPLLNTVETWLEGSPSLARLSAQRRDFQSDWEALHRIAPTLCHYSFSDFATARLIVSSRSFSIDQQPCLIPLADMLDHSAQANVVWKHSAAGFEAWSVREIEAGSPLLTSYGRKSNADLWLHYGFTIDAGVDEYLLEVGVKEAEKQGLLGKQSQSFLVPANPRLQALQAVLGFCRFAQLRDLRQLPRLMRHCENSETGSFEPERTPVQSLTNEYHALSLLQQVVLARINAYPERLEEDQQLLPSLPVGIYRDCIVVRRGEKAALAWLREFLDAAIEVIAGDQKAPTEGPFVAYFAELQSLHKLS